jgi:hypothetical protein
MVTGADGIKPGVGSETNFRRSPVRLSTYVLNPPSLKRAFCDVMPTAQNGILKSVTVRI